MANSKVIYKHYSQSDLWLLPPSLGDLVPENHPVRIVNAVMDKLDISAIEATYLGGGTSSYDPLMMLKLLVYGYLCNIYSGRKLARLCRENVIFMWLTGMNTPDFRTINLFRSKRLADGAFDEIFQQVVLLLNEEGLVSLEVQYIDGTKIESVANKYTFVWRGTVEKNKAKLLEKVKGVLKQAAEVGAAEQDEGPQETELTAEQCREKAASILQKMD